MASKETDERINLLFSRIQELESAAPVAANITSSPSEGWAKRNAYWFFPTLTVGIALIIGSGLLSLVAGSFVDGRVDAKLKDPLERLRRVEDGVLRIETKLDTLVNAFLSERLRAASGDIREKLGDINAAEFARVWSASPSTTVVEQTGESVKDSLAARKTGASLTDSPACSKALI